MRLVSAAQGRGARKDEDFPSITLVNRALPGLDAKGFCPANTKLLTAAVISNAQQLVQLGADIIVPACNSIDAVRGEVALAVKVPILSLPCIVSEAVRGHGWSRVAVLSSATERILGLYARRLPEITVISANEQQQERLTALIAHSIAGSWQGCHLDELRALISNMINQGVQGVIIGCTELSLLTSSLSDNLPIVDAVEEASRAAVEMCWPETQEALKGECAATSSAGKKL
jgi:aspartate racemase